ncbi:proline--tRNA ligase 1 [Paraliobacillus quinghaiensis]|uniref:Proline--tRNA ligase n=1 Tax=Paraliobacillus quinghaiensis TaxID=470815 RepID=A0A917WQN0_9BACI|nr:proline--tRNA ligase [Paraliobacillus quinghaiensis]GGM21672.1 proline--tRNA ligase 1 [Paraliobacillus quinghaiensis]
MKQSQTLVPTLKEIPAGADIASHQLLLRAGFIRQTASGIYSFLPLGKRVLRKIEEIVRDEMDNIGANEMLMPALQPAELWKETGRWNAFGLELMRMNDRHEREFALGATHEEVITSLIKDEVKSYKKLPLTVYQIQSKFRDEQRPRFGLLRGREFLMKDAYSFHESYASLDEMYDKMYEAYSNIFTRLGLNFRAVIADSGAMGGKDTHEFMALSEVGEDTIAFSDTSSYAANIEMAQVLDQADDDQSGEELLPLDKVATPNQKTMEQVADYLKHPLAKGLKSLLYKVDETFLLVVTRGDHQVNDIKLKNFYQATTVELATEADVEEILGAGFGSIGPIDVKNKEVDVIFDFAVRYVVNATCGANQDGYHYVNVNPERDFDPEAKYADVRFVQEGDPSPDGKGQIQFARGIEIGQVFKLGEFYADKLGASFLNDQGRASTMIMGCYGVGVSRTLAAIVEQYHDEKGITWPSQIAPFQVHLLVLNSKKDEQKQLADQLYANLKAQGIEVLYDDRTDRAGVKFADSDLIGIPYRVTVGKRADEGIVECKIRVSGEQSECHKDDVISYVKSLLS